MVLRPMFPVNGDFHPSHQEQLICTNIVVKDSMAHRRKLMVEGQEDFAVDGTKNQEPESEL